MHPQEFTSEARWTVIGELLDYAKQNWCLVTLKDMKAILAP